jgi:hypothetical protein
MDLGFIHFGFGLPGGFDDLMVDGVSRVSRHGEQGGRPQIKVATM